jgi:hypothetical protein
MALPPPSSPTPKPYPPQWETVADLRVFRTTSEEWEKLIGWRADMGKRGWKLLRVSSDGPELVAVFGRTKADRAGTSARRPDA